MNRPERPSGSVGGVVLAGGDSTRFGSGDKALATVDSQPILARIVDVLRRTTDGEPVIAVRTCEQQSAYADVVPPGVRFVFDAPDHDGPVAGLSSAATAVEARWLFCCGCDMPLLAPSAVEWLLDQLGTLSTRHHQPTGQRPTDHQPVDALAVEAPSGGIEPLHTVYRRASVLECRESLPRTAGLRMLLSELDSVVTVSTADAPAHVPLEASTTNVNTDSELAVVRNTNS